MLVGTDDTGVPWGNPHVWLGDHMTILHADAGYRTRVAAVRGECVNTAPARHHFSRPAFASTIVAKQYSGKAMCVHYDWSGLEE